MKYSPLERVFDFNKTLYFLSEKNFNDVLLKPRIPHTILQGVEDPKTKRICCSRSISGAFRALETIGTYKLLYVHIIENVEEIAKSGNLIKPTPDRVADVDRTDEFWITCPVKLKCIGKVSIGYDAFSQNFGTPEGEHVHFKYVEKFSNVNDTMNESFLNETSKIERLAAGDHSRIQIVQIKPLQNELIKKGYKCTLFPKTARELRNVNYDMILRRSKNEVSYVRLFRRRRSTNSDNILLPIGKFDNKFSVFDDETINEICIICPPQLNSDPYGSVVDNTKACFFDKNVLLNAYVNGKLKAVTTREGDSIIIPEKWAKTNAKEVVPYKYIRDKKCYIRENLNINGLNDILKNATFQFTLCGTHLIRGVLSRDNQTMFELNQRRISEFEIIKMSEGTYKFIVPLDKAFINGDRLLVRKGDTFTLILSSNKLNDTIATKIGRFLRKNVIYDLNNIQRNDENEGQQILDAIDKYCLSNDIICENFNALVEKQQLSKWIEDHFKITTTKNSLDKTIEMKWFVPKDHSGDSRFYADGGKPSAIMKFFRDHEITKFIGNSLGFSEKEQKWYGWSHRAIHGFGIGDKSLELYPYASKTGKKCKTLADCKKAAKAFAKSVD